MRFETVQIHFLSNVFGLSSFRNFATMATWRNDFSLYLYRAGRLFLAGYKPFWKKKKLELCTFLSDF